MRLSALVVAAAAALAGAVVAAVYGAAAGRQTALLVGGVSALALLAAHLIAERPSRRRPLHRRFALAAAVAVGVVLAAVAAAAELMFVSEHDALMVGAMVGAATLVALRASRVASAGVVREVAALRDVLQAVGAGTEAPPARASSAGELVELADAANAMVARLDAEQQRRDASEQARRNLVAAISHDLRTPLTALRLMVDAIEDGVADEPTRHRYLAGMRTHVDALGTMVDDLFELSRLQAGELEWSLQQVELGALVQETVSAMRVEAEARGIELAAQLDPSLGPARADPERLQRVLFNLIRNAIRHTPPDGSVIVRAEPDGDWLGVEVADSGTGIAEADRERIFDAFVRGDAARSDGGAGLGLAISRAIVEAHGGRIWVADSAAGASVRFVIPA
jgi:signal transduction histidine kinase